MEEWQQATFHVDFNWHFKGTGRTSPAGGGGRLALFLGRWVVCPPHGGTPERRLEQMWVQLQLSDTFPSGPYGQASCSCLCPENVCGLICDTHVLMVLPQPYNLPLR